MLNFGAYCNPAYLIEKNTEGNAVVFVPKDQGQIFIVNTDDIKLMTDTILENFDASVKTLGKGILSFK